MATALIYVLVLLVVAALFFVGASVLFGRGEELAPLPPGASPTWLPAGEVAAADVRAVRFQQAVRGYRMAEVDWALDRLAGELDRLAGERADLRRRIGELEGVAAPGGDPADDEPATGDEPADDEPADEEPAADAPATEEPAADAPATLEPAADERTEA